MLEKIKALLARLGFKLEGKTDDEIVKVAKEAGIPVEEQTTTNVPLVPVNLQNANSNSSVIADLNKQIHNLTNLIAKQQQEKEAELKAHAERIKAESEKKINDAIDKALKENKISVADKDLWRTRLTKDYDEWSKELEAKGVMKHSQKPTIAPDKKENLSSEPNNNPLRIDRNALKRAIAVDIEIAKEGKNNSTNLEK
jgi:type III secretion system FlhB-like substrate exporter